MTDKSKVSTYDRMTMMIAVLALTITLYTTYLQFVHSPTKLDILGFDIIANENETADTLWLNTNLLFANKGKNPVAINNWSTYLSTNDKFPEKGVQGSNGWGAILDYDFTTYTYYLFDEPIEDIFEPNTVKFIPIKLGIDVMNIKKLKESNNMNDDQRFKLGFAMKFYDSKGEVKWLRKYIGDIKIDLYTKSDTIEIDGVSTSSLSKQLIKIF